MTAQEAVTALVAQGLWGRAAAVAVADRGAGVSDAWEALLLLQAHADAATHGTQALRRRLPRVPMHDCPLTPHTCCAFCPC